MAAIRIDGIGVGQYNANQIKIEAEDYFKADGCKKKESENTFFVETTANKSYLNFPNINGLDNYSKLNLKVSAPNGGKFLIQIRKNNLKGELVNEKTFNLKRSEGYFENLKIDLHSLESKEIFYFLIEQLDNNALLIDSFSFSK